MFKSTIINGVKVVAHDFFLDALLKAHKELVDKKIGVDGKLGFVPGPQRTASWRSLETQKALVSAGASMTLYSNHRRGTAVDCFASWDYIDKIKPVMNKYGLVNDLAFTNKARTKADDTRDADTPVAWDGGHWNWKSNAEAAKFPVVDTMKEIPDFKTMGNEPMFEIIQLTEPGVPGSGSFALMVKGQKRVISTQIEIDGKVYNERGAAAILTLLCKKHLTKAAWDAIPTGEKF